MEQAQVQQATNPPRKTSSFTGLPRPPSRTDSTPYSNMNNSNGIVKPSAVVVPDLINKYERRVVVTQDQRVQHMTQTTSQIASNRLPSKPSIVNPTYPTPAIGIPTQPQLTLASHPISAGPSSGPISQPSPASSISSYLRPTPSSYDLGSELNSPEGSPHHPSTITSRRASPTSSSPSSPSQLKQRGVYPQAASTDGSVQRLTCRTASRSQLTDNQLAHASSHGS
jgi:hypothetical protein